MQKYQWVDQGSSYLLAEVLAAQLVGQIENFDRIQDRRIEIWDSYCEKLSKNDFTSFFTTQQISNDSTNVAHMFYVDYLNKQYRETMRIKMLQAGIVSTSHYLPLESSIMGRQFSKFKITTNRSKIISDSILRLPVYSLLTDEQIEKITSILECQVRNYKD